MAEFCYSPLMICAIRGARLDSGGAPAPGANNLWESRTMLSLGVQPQTEAGTRINVKTGCDETCLTYEGQDKPTFDTLSLELCQLEIGLLEILTGGTVITSGGDVVGFERRPASAGRYDGASLETWSIAWDGDQQAVDAVTGDPLYFKFAWPKTTWTVGSMTFGNDAVRIPLTGKGLRNSQFGTGPLGDWPTAISEPGAFVLTTEIPDGECGYQSLAS